MKWNIDALGEAQQKALQELAGILGVEFGSGADSLAIEVNCGADGLLVEKDGNRAILHLAREGQFARAASLLAQGKTGAEPEQQAYDHLELMWDCSRNSVPNMQGFQKMVRHLSLMGYTGIQLYTEDTFELEKYPYFGYMRGRFTADELKEMDSYAGLFSIELVPCIQTLAHLPQALRWAPFEKTVLDCNDILLADCDDTYALIEEMVSTMAGALKSRRINIGMDEAHMLGLGKYLEQHGFQDRMDIMLRHFNRVMDIVRKYGYKPMMWSDMFFRLLSGGEYYAENVRLSDEARSRIPDDVTLVYWDYYSLDKQRYSKMLASHKQMSDHIAFAGGAWTWVGLSPYNRFSLAASEAAEAACREHGIKDIIVTSWGDDGAETPAFDVLPSLQFWAEKCYGCTSQEDMEARFTACTGGNWADFLLLDSGSTPPNSPAPGLQGTTPSRYLLYNDLMLGLCDLHIPAEYPAFYQEAAAKLEAAADRNPSWKVNFQTQAALCDLFAIKACAGIELRKAYLEGDKETLEHYVSSKLDDMYARLARFTETFRRQWLQDFKVFGLEICEVRLGGLKERILIAKQRLRQYLDGEIDRLEEFEQKLLPFDGADSITPVLKYTFWGEIFTAGVISQ